MSFLKRLIFVIGVLTLLWIFSTQFELRDPNVPRIIDPSHPIDVPKISVSKK